MVAVITKILWKADIQKEKAKIIVRKLNNFKITSENRVQYSNHIVLSLNFESEVLTYESSTLTAKHGFSDQEIKNINSFINLIMLTLLDIIDRKENFSFKDRIVMTKIYILYKHYFKNIVFKVFRNYKYIEHSFLDYKGRNQTVILFTEIIEYPNNQKID